LSLKGDLRVNSNQFTGQIRDGFTQWSRLDFADFSDNVFTGTLPSSIFDIQTIRILYFQDNRIDGTIPPNFGNSPLLRDLYLQSNVLSGTVPGIEPAKLLSLTEFLLEDNQLTGSMPASVCQLRLIGSGSLDDLWVDCGSTANPRIQCDIPACCTLCLPLDP
jgi:hypothetical protein